MKTPQKHRIKCTFWSLSLTSTFSKIYNGAYFCLIFLTFLCTTTIIMVWHFCKKKMEDDVEVELELEKQLSLAHEMFWQDKPSSTYHTSRSHSNKLLNYFYLNYEETTTANHVDENLILMKNKLKISSSYVHPISFHLQSSSYLCTPLKWEGNYYHSNLTFTWNFLPSCVNNEIT
jgi:hypothetical protein